MNKVTGVKIIQYVVQQKLGDVDSIIAKLEAIALESNTASRKLKISLLFSFEHQRAMSRFVNQIIRDGASNG